MEITINGFTFSEEKADEYPIISIDIEENFSFWRKFIPGSIFVFASVVLYKLSPD